MGSVSCNTDPDKMKLLLLAWLHLSGSGLGVFAQCDAELPSGKACGQEDFFMEADPEACSFFYDCSAGCISHMQCEPHSDGLPRVFDAVSISSIYQPSHKTFSMGSGLHRGLHC